MSSRRRSPRQRFCRQKPMVAPGLNPVTAFSHPLTTTTHQEQTSHRRTTREIWKTMMNQSNSNSTRQQSSRYPIPNSASFLAVGDGAHESLSLAPSDIQAVCHIQGSAQDLYYYSTTFSGGPQVSTTHIRQLYSRTHSTSLSSGVFDTPKEKCPSGHGSRVTGGNRVVSQSILPSPSKHIDIPKATHSPYGPPTPGASPDTSPVHMNAVASIDMCSGLVTPPTTPPNGISTLSHAGHSLLLSKLFPNHAREAAKFAQGVCIESMQPDGSCTWWDGFILQTPPAAAPGSGYANASGVAKTRAAPAASATRTLFMSAQNALGQQDRVRESIVAVLDLAGEHLECDAVVMVLDKGASGKQELAGLVHSLLYVGGTVVTKPPFAVDPRYVLVGIEV